MQKRPDRGAVRLGVIAVNRERKKVVLPGVRGIKVVMYKLVVCTVRRQAKPGYMIYKRKTKWAGAGG
jgi:hypothetical protein